MSRENLRQHKLLQMAAFGDIRAREELFVDYGEEFVFQKTDNTQYSDRSRTRTEVSDYITN